MKIDQTTVLILAVVGVGAYFLFRPKPAGANLSSNRPDGEWGQTYTDSKGRTVVEGFDRSGQARSYISYSGASK